MEIIDFQDKKYRVITKINEVRVEDHNKLKDLYNADLDLRDKNGFYFVLEEIIDAEFTDIN